MFVEGGEETQGFVGFGQQTISSIAFYHYELYLRYVHAIFSVISEGYSQIEMSLKVLTNKFSTSEARHLRR